jgi:hypothetical protein
MAPVNSGGGENLTLNILQNAARTSSRFSVIDRRGEAERFTRGAVLRIELQEIGNPGIRFGASCTTVAEAGPRATLLGCGSLGFERSRLVPAERVGEPLRLVSPRPIDAASFAASRSISSSSVRSSYLFVTWPSAEADVTRYAGAIALLYRS